jgi:aryl-alcohol dehydrogenase-like predicted oxidoreductase
MLGLERRPLGASDYRATFLGFGALEIGRDWGLGEGSERERPSGEVAGQVLNAVLDLGINLIDTASAYHASEERIGRYISHRRQEYILASKCGEHSREPHTYYDFSYRAIAESIDRSLALLQTDRIDLMQIHFGPDPAKVLDDGETVAAMVDAQQAGKVALLGASTGGDIARRCIESGDFDVMQLSYSLLNRRDEDLVDLCGERGIGVLIRGGLGAGRLTPRVVPHLPEMDEGTRSKINALIDLLDGDPDKLVALALKFLHRNPNVTSVLAGSKNAAHVRSNLDMLELDLDDSLIERAIQITQASLPC